MPSSTEINVDGRRTKTSNRHARGKKRLAGTSVSHTSGIKKIASAHKDKYLIASHVLFLLGEFCNDFVGQVAKNNATVVRNYSCPKTFSSKYAALAVKLAVPGPLGEEVATKGIEALAAREECMNKESVSRKSAARAARAASLA